MYRTSPKLESAIMLGMLSIRYHNNCEDSSNKYNYWEEIGYEIAGPAVFVYAKFILE